jgi:hypothetical protein
MRAIRREEWGCMKPNIGELISFGDRAVNAVVSAMPSMRFDVNRRSHVYAVTLHASIVQLCGGSLAMARTEYTAGIPIVLRSIYEALVDLDILVSARPITSGWTRLTCSK